MAVGIMFVFGDLFSFVFSCLQIWVNCPTWVFLCTRGSNLGISYAMLCFGLGVFRGQEWTGDVFILILLCTLGRLTSTTTKYENVPFLLSIAPEFVVDRSTANQQEMLRNSKAPCGRWLLSRYSPKQLGQRSAGRGFCTW